METMRALCVDTDIILDYLRGREPEKTAFANWRKRAEILITGITTFELLLGANLSSKREERIIEGESLLNTKYWSLTVTAQTKPLRKGQN